MAIYVISDTHFNHTNIIAYCNRPFLSVEEMNEALVYNWNKTVKDTDIVYCLGDFALCNKQDIEKFVSRLNGYKILVMGNHDHATASTYQKAGFDEVYKEETNIEFLGQHIKFSHHRKDGGEDIEFINIYGHVHDKPDDDAKHKCACVELWNYTPVLLEDLLQ